MNLGWLVYTIVLNLHDSTTCCGEIKWPKSAGMYIFQYTSSEKEELGKKRYEAQKLERIETKERNGEVITPISLPGKTSLLYTQIYNVHHIY